MALPLLFPADIDKRYRWAVCHFAELAELTAIKSDLERLFQGPSRPDAQGALNLMGDDAKAILCRTAKIVDGLDHFCKGFKNWLGMSGWGDDYRLIQIFDAWSQEAERRKRLRPNVHVAKRLMESTAHGRVLH